MPFVNCAIGTLSPFTPTTDIPWNRSSATHLMRRMQMGASVNTIDFLLNQDPVEVVNTLVENAINLPFAQEPEWAFWQRSDYPIGNDAFVEAIVQQRIDWTVEWVRSIKNNGLRDRMSFFWHNHFVTDINTYGYSSWMYQYHFLLQKHALGNFKEFVREIGLTPAMLIYLDGYVNTRFEPNENYARELYELFTLGVDNGYTQQDITETARAITGWNTTDYNDLGGPFSFNAALFDPGQKTIFGRTGNWGYNDVIDILFEERAEEISTHICGKLYRHFVNPKEDEQIIADLAVILRENNWELVPIMKALFCSQHFFHPANYSTIIPGHVEHFLMFLNELELTKTDELLYSIAVASGEYGQAIFSPVNVAGWPGNRSWINSGSFSFRSGNTDNVLLYVASLNDGNGGFLRSWLTAVVGEQETDPDSITDQVIEFLFPKKFQFENEYQEARKVFRMEDVIDPSYYLNGTWTLNYETVPQQIFNLLVHLSLSPEFQLK